MSAAEAIFVGHAADELAGAQALGMRTVACHADADAVADVTIATFASLLTLPVLELAGPHQEDGETVARRR